MKNKMGYFLLNLIFLGLIFSCSVEKNKSQNSENKSPKNVILLISDGAGLSHISSAFYFKKSIPNYQRFKTIGLINTTSADNLVTDSGAGATAFACGTKTYNGSIGVDNESVAAENLFEIASKFKTKTGIVATSSVTHATPASFFAHAKSRNLEELIAEQFLESEIDFVAAGGLRFFNQRKDGKDLIENFAKNKFVLDSTKLLGITEISTAQKVAFLLSEEGMPKREEGRKDFLPQATKLAIDFLSKENSNFFLMVEGSQIDWAGHENDFEYLVDELIDFDDAIGVALDFAEKNTETLVVVLSDHETGGFAMVEKSSKKEKITEKNQELEGVFSTNEHSASLIPVFAYGPGSEIFAGVYDNTEIFYKILQATNWRK